MRTLAFSTFVLLVSVANAMAQNEAPLFYRHSPEPPQAHAQSSGPYMHLQMGTEVSPHGGGTSVGPGMYQNQPGVGGGSGYPFRP
jgi:hypothetical protein